VSRGCDRRLITKDRIRSDATVRSISGAGKREEHVVARASGGASEQSGTVDPHSKRKDEDQATLAPVPCTRFSVRVIKSSDHDDQSKVAEPEVVSLSSQSPAAASPSMSQLDTVSR
jgi:hypothetical protein